MYRWRIGVAVIAAGSLAFASGAARAASQADEDLAKVIAQFNAQSVFEIDFHAQWKGKPVQTAHLSAKQNDFFEPGGGCGLVYNYVNNKTNSGADEHLIRIDFNIPQKIYAASLADDFKKKLAAQGKFPDKIWTTPPYYFVYAERGPQDQSSIVVRDKAQADKAVDLMRKIMALCTKGR